MTFRIGIEPNVFTLSSLLAFALLLWFTRKLARLVDLVPNKHVFSYLRIPLGVPYAITISSRFTFIMIGILAALSMLGFRWTN